MKRLFVSTILLILVVITLTGCGENASEPNQGDVYVYVAVPLSGFQANGGQTVLGGARLAAEQINRRGGLRGYRIVVRPLDDQSDSEVAVANVEEIRSAVNDGDEVLGVIGHLNSGQTDATLELYAELDLVVITPTASEQSLTQRGYEHFFRVNANDAVQAAVDARFLVEEIDASSIAVVHNDTEYGRGLADSLADELSALGASEALRIEVAEGQSDYNSVVTQIQNSVADAIFYAGYEIEAPYFRAALVENGVDLPLLASDGAFLGATIDESAGTAEGMYVSAFAPSPENAADGQWIEAYRAVEYRDPDTYSVNGYIAMQVLAEGVRQADAFGAGAIAQALRSSSVSTLLGDLQYGDNGDLADPQIWIYQVEDNEFQQVQ